MRLQSCALNREKVERSNFAGLRLERVKVRVTVVREAGRRPGLEQRAFPP